MGLDISLRISKSVVLPIPPSLWLSPLAFHLSPNSEEWQVLTLPLARLDLHPKPSLLIRKMGTANPLC